MWHMGDKMEEEQCEVWGLEWQEQCGVWGLEWQEQCDVWGLQWQRNKVAYEGYNLQEPCDV